MVKLNEKELAELKKYIEEYFNKFISNLSFEEYEKLKKHLVNNMQLCMEDIEYLKEDVEYHEALLQLKNAPDKSATKLIKGLTIFLSTYLTGTLVNVIAGNRFDTVVMGCVLGLLIGISIDDLMVKLHENRTIPHLFTKAHLRKYNKTLNRLEQDYWEASYLLYVMDKYEQKNPSYYCEVDKEYVYEK